MRETIRFEELNTADLQAARFDKVILPIGSCESHGDHLPFGIDAMIAYDLALAVAGRVPRTMVLPPIWYGMSHHYRHQPMCVSVTNDTNIRVYRDVLDSVIHWGYRKILVINGHDGNIPGIEVAAQDIKIKHPEVGLAVLGAWWTAGLATAATREKGERFKQALVDHLVGFLARKDAQGWVIPRREA